MGFFNFLRKQFVDIIEWNEDSSGILAYRFPMQDQEIQNGAQLTVRDSQVALFVDEGNVADIFAAGRHTISTRNLPMLTSIKHWDKGFLSPFKSDVYFFSTREQIDQRWGTTTPITVRDKQFGPVRLRAHGTYSYRLQNPKTFFSKISGTSDAYSTDQLEGQLRANVLTNLAAFFGKGDIAFLDMAANQMKFSEVLKEALAPAFSDYGLKLETFYVQSISLPEELQSHLDKVAAMNMVGDLGKYAKFQTADSITMAAQNPSGGAGAGFAMMAGMNSAQQLGQAMHMEDSSKSATEEDALQTIQKLHELMTKGILSQEEFNIKKAELLKKI